MEVFHPHPDGENAISLSYNEEKSGQAMTRFLSIVAESSILTPEYPDGKLLVSQMHQASQEDTVPLQSQKSALLPHSPQTENGNSRKNKCHIVPLEELIYGTHLPMNCD